MQDSIKNLSFSQIKKMFDGKLDYVALAKHLGIKTPKSKDKTED
jgi:hypothetical protein